MWGQWLKDQRGAFTLEASVVLPVILIITVLIMLLGLHRYYSVQSYTTAYEAAERSAFVWTNSHRHIISGTFSTNQYDALYWRLTSNGDSNVVKSETQSVSLPELKLKRALLQIPSGWNAELSYRKSFLLGTVNVKTGRAFQSGSLFPLKPIRAQASQMVLDPVELVRNVDLAARAIDAFRKKAETSEQESKQREQQSQDQGNESDPGNSSNEALSFDNHNEALRYLRTIVKGKYASGSTTSTGEWRMIDALDEDGIAHQVYLGKKEYQGDIKDQLAKDVELIQTGKVKGVVWHFFKRSNQPNYGPSPSLQKQLQKQGIMLIVHE